MSGDKKTQDTDRRRVDESVEFRESRSANREQARQPVSVQRLEPAPTAPPKKPSGEGGQK